MGSSFVAQLIEPAAAAMRSIARLACDQQADFMEPSGAAEGGCAAWRLDIQARDIKIAAKQRRFAKQNKILKNEMKDFPSRRDKLRKTSRPEGTKINKIQN